MKKPVVAITRPADRAKKACDIVEKLGGSSVLAPTLDLKPVNTDSLKNLVENKNSFDWIIFTSPTTIVSLNKFYPDYCPSRTMSQCSATETYCGLKHLNKVISSTNVLRVYIQTSEQYNQDG